MFRTRDGKFTKKVASFNNLIIFKSSTESLDKDNCIVEGRRIVGLSEIVHQLQEGCRKCGTELRLREIKCERRVGLASLLTIDLHNSYPCNPYMAIYLRIYYHIPLYIIFTNPTLSGFNHAIMKQYHPNNDDF